MSPLRHEFLVTVAGTFLVLVGGSLLIASVIAALIGAFAVTQSWTNAGRIFAVGAGCLVVGSVCAVGAIAIRRRLKAMVRERGAKPGFEVLPRE